MNHQHQDQPANPEIVHHDGGTTLTGAGIELHRIATISMGISLWARCKVKLTRGASISFLLAEAGKVTGKKYKRTEAQTALEDLNRHIAVLKGSLAVVDERTEPEA